MEESELSVPVLLTLSSSLELDDPTNEDWEDEENALLDKLDPGLSFEEELEKSLSLESESLRLLEESRLEELLDESLTVNDHEKLPRLWT